MMPIASMCVVGRDKLQFIINGTSYLLDAKAPQGPEQSLWIKANGGDDRVIVDDDVKHVLQVDGGRGHDFIQAGGGISALFGGAGNDNLILGGNDGYAEGNDGDDLILWSGQHVTIRQRGQRPALRRGWQRE